MREPEKKEGVNWDGREERETGNAGGGRKRRVEGIKHCEWMQCGRQKV